MQVLERMLSEIDDLIVHSAWPNMNLVKKEEVEEIIRSHMEDDGWISAESEEKPPAEGYIYLSFANFDLPLVGRYEEDETGGAFYIGDDEETCISQDMIVNAWRPVDKPYRPKQQKNGTGGLTDGNSM